MLLLCKATARILYWLRLLDNGAWGPDWYAIYWYCRFNPDRAKELAKMKFPDTIYE